MGWHENSLLCKKLMNLRSGILSQINENQLQRGWVLLDKNKLAYTPNLVALPGGNFSGFHEHLKKT